jgi:hypothetical protein
VGFLSNKRRKSDHTDYPVSILDRPFVEEKTSTLENSSQGEIRWYRKLAAQGKEWVNIKEQLTFRDVTGKSIWKERLP